VAIAVTIAVYVLIIGAWLFERTPKDVDGTVRAEGTPVGTFTFAVTACAAGHGRSPGFFGADLLGEGGFDLRVVGSGDGARMFLYPQGAASDAIQFAKPDCTRWQVAVEWGPGTANYGMGTLVGHVRVSCSVGGGRLNADVEFKNCKP